MSDHLFLGKREKYLYWTQSILWTIHQILTPFSFPRGSREMASQILIAQSNLKRSIQKGVIPKRLWTKKYFKDAVLLFGIEAQANGEKVPRILQNAVPSDLLSWWPKDLRRRYCSLRKCRLHPEPRMVQGVIYTQGRTPYFNGINRLGSQRASCGKKNNNPAATTRLIKNG
jgi:hypothetical protein